MKLVEKMTSKKKNKIKKNNNFLIIIDIMYVITVSST